MRRLSPLLLVVLALVLGACGSSSSDDKSTSAPAPSTPAAGGGASAGGTKVTLKNTAFAPKTVTVKVGQKVTWTNDDGFDHNVTATKGASFKSSNFGKDGTFSFTPTKAGTISYVCTIHPGMDGTLTVQ